MSKQYYIPEELVKQFKATKQTDKDISKDTKMTIISLAYTDSLSVSDLIELSEILETIAAYKSSTDKKERTINKWPIQTTEP